MEAVLFMGKRKWEKSTDSASTYEERIEEEKKLVLLSFREERIEGAYTIKKRTRRSHLEKC